MKQRRKIRFYLTLIFRDCPAEVKEAVSTVIYAAPRTEVKELVAVRTKSKEITFIIRKTTSRRERRRGER